MRWPGTKLVSADAAGFHAGLSQNGPRSAKVRFCIPVNWVPSNHDVPALVLALQWHSVCAQLKVSSLRYGCRSMTQYKMHHPWCTRSGFLLRGRDTWIYSQSERRLPQSARRVSRSERASECASKFVSVVVLCRAGSELQCP